MSAAKMNATSEPDEVLPTEEDARIEQAREKAYILYEGKRVPHRSCGIALAETFNVPTRPFQSLRRGGLTGEGECGAIKGGELILGYYLGDPDPTGAVAAELREAMIRYRKEWSARVDRGQSSNSAEAPVRAQDIICNTLTAPFEDFTGPERQQFCTNIAAEIAAIVAGILVQHGAEFEVLPIQESSDQPAE